MRPDLLWPPPCRVLIESGRLDDFAVNPTEFIEDDKGERLYLVVETKGSAFLDDLRNAERAKVECGKAHFEALQVGESPARFRVVHKADELLA